MKEVRWVEVEGKVKKVAGLVIDYDTYIPQVVYEGRVIRLGNDLEDYDAVERFVCKEIARIEDERVEAKRRFAWS